MLQVESLGVEVANPFHHFVILGIFRVGNYFLEIFIAPHAAHIFGRTGSLALNDRASVARAFNRLKQLLSDELDSKPLPAITMLYQSLVG